MRSRTSRFFPRPVAATSLAIALACGALFAVATSLQAGDLSGQLAARMTLEPSCAVSETDELSAANTLFSGNAGLSHITCSQDATSLSIGIHLAHSAVQGNSVGGDAVGMVHSGSGLPSKVFSDPSATTALPRGSSAVGVTLPSTGPAQAPPAYGRLLKAGANALAAGLDADTLQVVLSW